ncbi:MAG: hypothetical protein GX893_02345 [Firmicutes bacterium]|nr:hypothetical protein [Bacillota bacterium]
MLKLERKNDFLYGSIAGSIGAIAKYIFNELAQFLGLAKYDNNATALTVVFSSYQDTPLYILLGLLHAVMIGAFFGVVLAFIFDYVLTEKYYLLKAVAYGVFIYLLNFGLMSKIFSYPQDMTRLPGDVVVMFLSLIIYAVVTAYVLKKIGFWQTE